MEESELNPPDWLPDGWIMEVRKGKKGFTYRYYTCPISGNTFCSKEEVFCYLTNIEPVPRARTIKSFEDNDQKLVLEVKDSLKWLPRGWVIEIRVRETSEKGQEKYKCYKHQSTGSIFYCKEEVLKFHEKENSYDCSASTGSGYCKRKPDENLLSRIEYSPEDLPYGWIKETKYRRNVDTETHTRQDPYYIHPESGYVFRTLKDCFLYINDGVLSKYASKPRRHSICDILSLGNDSPDSTSPKKGRSEGKDCEDIPLSKPDSRVKQEVDEDTLHR
ncbi:hypothetical protein Cni_G27015 [Canna indica]|uniref:MBD domain-containing protein n=1 Tax=Canna indica TaxID=4628 RepID=A0AAQ3L036_9LILI|nr:hypothetical protein Cni_G27015 [Canna indica]